MKYYLLGIFILISITFIYQDSYAVVQATKTINLGKLVTGSVYTTTPNIVTIDLSPQCIALVKMNKTDDCPSYETLYKKYDNTNTKMSGRFITTDNFFHRTAPQTTLHYEMYPPSKKIVMVDPDYLSIVHSKEIIIVPHGFTYINKIESIGNNHTRNEYHDRYVFACHSAKIVFSDFLLNDTINYLQNGCTKTNFKEKVSIKMNHTTLTYNNPYSSSHYFDYVKQIFNGHHISVSNKTAGGLGPGNLINSKSNALKDPYSSWKH